MFIDSANPRIPLTTVVSKIVLKHSSRFTRSVLNKNMETLARYIITDFIAIIAFIEEPDVMKKILKHLGLNPLFPADFSQLPG